MYTSLLHRDTENYLTNRFNSRTISLIALITATLGVFILPLLAALPLAHYVLATTDNDPHEDDRRTHVTRGLAGVALIVGYVWVAVLLFAWLT